MLSTTLSPSCSLSVPNQISHHRFSPSGHPSFSQVAAEALKRSFRVSCLLLLLSGNNTIRKAEKMASSAIVSRTSTTYSSPLSSLASQNKPRNLSSSPSSLSLSSNQTISNFPLQFHAKGRPFTKPFSSTATRPLRIISMAPPKPGGKPKKVIGVIKLALEAGKATPSPPVGPALGSKGVNIMAFCKDYNARTADKAGFVIPVEITVYDDKSFTFILKTPPASVLLLKAAGVDKGSKDPKQEKVGKITIDQLRSIAQEKLPDLNCSSIESAMRIIAGTAANMGIDVDPPVLEPKKKELV